MFFSYLTLTTGDLYVANSRYCTRRNLKQYGIEKKHVLLNFIGGFAESSNVNALPSLDLKISRSPPETPQNALKRHY